VANADQFGIIQEIGQRVLAAAPPGWWELAIDYAVDDSQSDVSISCLVKEKAEVVERSLPFVTEIDALLRRLRAHLPGSRPEPFSTCRIHFFSDGRYDARYGYDPINWDRAISSQSNFGTRTK